MKTRKKNEDQRELRQPVRRAHEATFNFNCLLFYFRFQRCGESAIPLGLSLSRHLVKKCFQDYMNDARLRLQSQQRHLSL